MYNIYNILRNIQLSIPDLVYHGFFEFHVHVNLRLAHYLNTLEGLPLRQYWHVKLVLNLSLLRDKFF